MKTLNGEVNMPDDKLRQLEAEIQALRDENHRLRSDNAAALFKLEEQRAIEKRYEESQSRFQAIFYQSKMGNKIITPDLRLLQINPALQEMLGYSEEEIVGTRIIEYAHPEFIHRWHELQENLWTKQIPSFQIETKLIKKDGTAFWCQVTSILFRDNGATLGYTIVENINKRKVLEATLQRQYDNQETIMHMVAHDLKSPLYNIQLTSNFLKENLAQLPDLAPEAKAENLNLIQLISDTCNTAFATIKDLLLIGELEATYLDLENTDLKCFIQSQLTPLGVAAQKKEINLNFHYPEEPVYARINPDKFTRVLINLLSNAVKFTNTGGQVTLSLQNKGKKVLLQVSDSGIGIPEHLQASIFNKFTKANRIGTEGETTTGLGLYIVKQIVEKHEGEIWFESQEKIGTTFYIELPKT
ncbi:MAG: ATP-binding protein [Bacteroidota bacterium]|nr:ATP-binding protein [Bacteroidota bacterium]